jgi:hypothetical protein
LEVDREARYVKVERYRRPPESLRAIPMALAEDRGAERAGAAVVKEEEEEELVGEGSGMCVEPHCPMEELKASRESPE